MSIQGWVAFSGWAWDWGCPLSPTLGDPNFVESIFFPSLRGSLFRYFAIWNPRFAVGVNGLYQPWSCFRVMIWRVKSHWCQSTFCLFFVDQKLTDHSRSPFLSQTFCESRLSSSSHWRMQSPLKMRSPSSSFKKTFGLYLRSFCLFENFFVFLNEIPCYSLLSIENPSLK